MNVRTYQCSWSEQTKYITASTYSEARRLFRERFGFWPDESLVEITII